MSCANGPAVPTAGVAAWTYGPARAGSWCGVDLDPGPSDEDSDGDGSRRIGVYRRSHRAFSSCCSYRYSTSVSANRAG